MRNRKKTVLRRNQRTFLLANLTLVAILAATQPSMLAKVHAAANTYEWTKQVDLDLLGGYYTSAASSADGRHLLIGSTQGGEGSAEASPLYRSSDYGATWQNVTENADPNIRNYWTSVDVSNDGSIMVAASDRTSDSADVTGNNPGKIFVSQDGGDNWENISPDTTEDWVSIAVSGDSSRIVAVAADDQDNVYISDDIGDTWQTSPINEDLWHWESISISDDGDKILVGGENNSTAAALVEISEDGGDTWDSVSPNTSATSDILRTSMSANGDKIVVTNKGWNSGNIDNVYVSSNNGASWDDITPNDAENNVWSGVALSGDSSKLAVVDDNNNMYVSNDVGENWTEEDPGQAGGDSNTWRSVDFSDDGLLAIAVSSENAYVTQRITPTSQTVTLDDAEGGKTITITTPEGTIISCHSAVKESALTVKDGAYSYPLGLVDFCFSGAEASNQVSILFVTNLKPNEVTVRKYNPSNQSYATITDANVSQTTYEGNAALLVTYNIVDNGPLDTDPDTGEVADPVGLGIKELSSPNTGKQKHWLLSTKE